MAGLAAGVALLLFALNALIVVLATLSTKAASRVIGMQIKWATAVVYMINSKDKVRCNQSPVYSPLHQQPAQAHLSCNPY